MMMKMRQAPTKWNLIRNNEEIEIKKILNKICMKKLVGVYWEQLRRLSFFPAQGATEGLTICDVINNKN